RRTCVTKNWPGVVVANNVVHRTIANLRKAFGDDHCRPPCRSHNLDPYYPTDQAIRTVEYEVKALSIALRMRAR
ncbi:MAG: hypothetical protein O7C67_17775, partial [Gammaproteobacteria bacterium]|nr:hypothetical protein [Gammaproteobacteria bacterium]